MARATSSHQTFIGPVQKEPTSHRVHSYFFYLYDALAMQTPLKLTYPILHEANASRVTLLAAHNTYAVPSQKLLDAIVETVQKAKVVAPPADPVQSTAPEED